MERRVRRIRSYEQFRDAINGCPYVMLNAGQKYCGPCIEMTNVFEKASEKYSADFIEWYNVDLDEVPKIGMDLRTENIPNIAIYRNGKLVAVEVGSTTLFGLETFMEKHFDHESFARIRATLY